jgi:type IV secretory pathway VirB6-like protein
MLPMFLTQQGGIIPFNTGSLQIAQDISQAITQLTTVNAPVFLAKAQTLLNQLGLFALVLGALLWVWGYLTGNHHYAVRYYVQTLIAYLVAFNLLKYYIAPMPLIGYSFSGIFQAVASWMTAVVNVTTANQFFTGLAYIWANAEKPGFGDIVGSIMYVLLGIVLALIAIAAFGIVLYSFLALGVGVILGPFFIVAYLFVPTRNWFWNWVNFMLKYSFFQVVAAVYTNVMASAGLLFIAQAVHGDYSLGHLMALFVPWLALMCVAVFGVLQIPTLTGDLLSGGASAGAGVIVSASYAASKFRK